MKEKLQTLYNTLKEKGLTPEQEKKIRYELDLLELDGDHSFAAEADCP